MTLLFHGGSTLGKGGFSVIDSFAVTDETCFCLKRVVERKQVSNPGYNKALNSPEMERKTIGFSEDKK